MSGKELNAQAPSFVPGSGSSQSHENQQMPPDNVPHNMGRGGGGYGGGGYGPRGGGGPRYSDPQGRGGNRRPPMQQDPSGMMGGNSQMPYQQMSGGYHSPPPGMQGGPPMGMRNNNNNNYGWQQQGRGPFNGNNPPMPMYPNSMPLEAQRQYNAAPPSPQNRGPMSRGQQQQQQQQQQPLPPPPPVAQKTRSALSSPQPMAAPLAPAATGAMGGRPEPVAPVCKVIMVIGYCHSGKTEVAKAIAKKRGYEYVNLKGVSEETKEVEPTNDRLSALDTLLHTRKSQLKGIVLDDVLVRSRFEAYYANHILQRYQLNVNAVVLLAPPLSCLLTRDEAPYDTAEKMMLHPEGFELASRLEDATPGVAPITIVESEGTLDEVIAEVEEQLQATESRPMTAVQFAPVELMTKCVLVTEPELVDKIISAEMAVLNIDGGFGFPYVEPNFLLDYPAFARHGIQFKSYMVVPWVWGDKVSIIGYNGGVYVHLPSFRLVFKMDDSILPTPLGELMKKLNAEHDTADSHVPERPVTFSLEASMLDGVLYISDMMLIGATLGSKTLLPDRVKLLHSELGKLPQSGVIRLLEHFPVRDIEKCIKSCDKARGVLFVNPDGMMAGQYDSRNFLYPSEEVKTVRLRVWNGRMDNGRWLFDTYAQNPDKELPVEVNDEKVQIVINDADVETYSVNDGNIIECVLSTDTAATATPPAKGARRPGAKQVHSFIFGKRCRWESKPITLHYQREFSAPRTWTAARVQSACSSIQYTEAAMQGTA